MRRNEVSDLTVDPGEEFDGVVDVRDVLVLADETRGRIAEQQPENEQEAWRRETREELLD
ncbi:MAG: hypothetical protein Q7S29_02250 [Candidatus Peribacter sp.]|nr:hypothetical protein [Candidatus Peribacter sp.]